ncbi:hypothetical protein A8B78_11205 [Jannaschia sp. EhC01]|nr:hypothetical protein A8B78_11205 [Jannaschia sp. EhC01]
MSNQAHAITYRGVFEKLLHTAGFISRYRKAEQKVFHEASRFGINIGYSIPIAGQVGKLALFSVAARTEDALMQAVNGSAHLIYALAMHLHDHVLVLADDAAEKQTQIALTARQLECLKWTAEGLITEQIAARMVIFAATVNDYFSKTIPKFGAMNRQHAAIMAVRIGALQASSRCGAL